jgi:mono/diheme cytochrome c family protein
MMAKHYILAMLLVASLANPGTASGPRRVVEFNRDIRPTLSDNCFSCHGPDKNMRKASLRLDRPEGLFDDRHILVAGKPQESELFQRITAAESAEKMPPARTNKTLTHEQIELIRLWIEQGAKYQGHWAFLPPRRVNLPEVKNKRWARNAIDHFIMAKLESLGLEPSPQADRRTLIRRLSFDLLGLPPTAGEVEAFVADTNPQAYERLVDRLLASPHFGERMAVSWLDLVRYADSEGYISDGSRDVYPYRDWVIDAFNHNMPFDRFTIEQLAGDLLPQATSSQKTASGYNRVLQTANASGLNVKEYLAKFHADRVRNLSTVWLGLTMGCCECHDHKNDPLTTKEFYQLEAFFADIQEFKEEPPAPPSGVEKYIEKKHELESLKERRTAHVAGGFRKAWLFAGTMVVLPFAWVIAAFAALIQFVSPLVMSLSLLTLKADVNQLKINMDEQEERKKLAPKIIPNPLIPETGPPVTIRILPAGNWQNERGEIVGPGTPAILPPLRVTGTRPNRLDLARWLVKPDNPLPARVFVNRLWMLCMGQGLVKSLDDFGAQGASPTHPELLDWLALDFQESGGDIKRAIRQIVLSETYRQTSKGSPELRRRDPYNELFARQSRFRLDAEFVRDNALATSGLLERKIGGPSVKPYQPATYWENATGTWQDDPAPDRYRRGLYTYWRRTFLHPGLLVFDAPTREECTVERRRSNTPQQALVLLNDPTYVEAARVFAQRIILKGGNSTAERIQYAIHEALQRPARADEMKVLHDLVDLHLKQYQADPEAARDLAKVGGRPAPAEIEPSELAAWISVAQVILNLHESITRY